MKGQHSFVLKSSQLFCSLPFVLDCFGMDFSLPNFCRIVLCFVVVFVVLPVYHVTPSNNPSKKCSYFLIWSKQTHSSYISWNIIFVLTWEEVFFMLLLIFYYVNYWLRVIVALFSVGWVTERRNPTVLSLLSLSLSVNNVACYQFRNNELLLNVACVTN